MFIENKIIKIIAVINIIFLVFPLSLNALSIEKNINMPKEGDIILSPGKIELFLSPGENTKRNLEITNRTGAELNIKIDIEDFSGDEEFATRLLGEEKGMRSLKNYLKIDTAEFNLAHGEKASLAVEIDLVGQIDPGGLYSAVIVNASTVSGQMQNNEVDTTNNISFVSRLACLFFVRVLGEVNEGGYLKSFISEKNLYQQTPINFNVVYHNNGSVHLNPHGSIEIKNFFGWVIDEINIDPFFVMPGFSRKRIFEWDKELSFGRYTASLTLNRGYQDLEDKLKIGFWVMPVKTILITLFILLIFLISSWRFFKKFEIKKRE